MHISVSPNPYVDNSSEDAFSQIFSPNTIPMEGIDDITHDNLYFYKEIKKLNTKKTTTLEDFDQFYKKFTEIEEVNEIEAANYEKPSFSINISKEKIFSTFENEKYVNIINNDNDIVKLFNKKWTNSDKIENQEKNYKDDKNNKTKDCTTANFCIDIEICEEKENSINKIETEKNNKEKNGVSENKNIEDMNNNNTLTLDKAKGAKIKKQEENFFPFSPGKGIIQCFKICDGSTSSYNQIVNINSLSSQEYDNSLNKGDKNILAPNPINDNESSINNEEKNITDNNNDEDNSVYTEQIDNGNDNMLFRFTTKKYFINSNGKKRRIKKKRKYKSDDIRKKIKSRFHKTFKNIINNNLKKAGSKKLFDFLPQCFIGNVSKKTNFYCLELTFKEILLTDFISEYSDKYPNKNVDYKKYEKNKEVIQYLEKHPEISKKSGFDIIKNKKYKDLLNIYFNSSEFEDSVFRLKNENETNDYIQEYVLKAKNYVKFYSNYGKNKSRDENSEDDN